MFTTLLRLILLGAVVATLTGMESCRKNDQVRAVTTGHTPDELTDSVTYTDITKAAGITWKHVNGGDGRIFFPEAHGSGAAILDFDNDGWEDLLITQCRHWPGHRPKPESTMVLYRNNHDGTFTDVTKRAGLAVPMYGMGVTVGDYDNDGWDDLYFTNVGENYLFHNDHGVFHDVTKHAGVAGSGSWASSAMWIDYDNDGYLDLFCGYYIDWTIATDVYCTVDGKLKAICTPAHYPGNYSLLFHNNHDGTFKDVSKEAGLMGQMGKALGVTMIDYNNDGWTDMIVSNDISPNRLLMNDHGVFKDVGVEAGIAYDEEGKARAGMGIDWADADRDGKPTIMIGNFASEMDWVYKYQGNGVFHDRAPTDGIGTVSLPYNTFAILMFDYDYDGWPDMFSANGHVRPEESIQKNIPYRMHSLLFRNKTDGQFEEVGLQHMKGPFDLSIVGRGACYGDIDNDGNLDVLVVSNDDYPVLMKCVRKNSNHYLRIKLQGNKSNRNGFGARIFAKVGGMSMEEMMKSGSSFQGSNESVVTIGLGAATKVDELVIKWNVGTIDTLRNVAGDRLILVKEGTASAETVVAKP